MDDDIICMARAAGCHDNGEEFRFVELRYLAHFAALVRADERERIKAKPNVEYERGFIDGMQMQTKSRVDRAVNRMAEQAMLGVWQDVPGAVNFGITDPAAPRCLYPDCVGGQSGTVCHKHCPTPCPDCRGLGYDASGQLCGCQGNPSF